MLYANRFTVRFSVFRNLRGRSNKQNELIIWCTTVRGWCKVCRFSTHSPLFIYLFIYYLPSVRRYDLKGRYINILLFRMMQWTHYIILKWVLIHSKLISGCVSYEQGVGNILLEVQKWGCLCYMSVYSIIWSNRQYIYIYIYVYIIPWDLVHSNLHFQTPDVYSGRFWTLNYVYNLIYKYQVYCSLSDTPCDLQAEYKQVDIWGSFDLGIGRF